MALFRNKPGLGMILSAVALLVGLVIWAFAPGEHPEEYYEGRIWQLMFFILVFAAVLLLAAAARLVFALIKNHRSKVS